MTKTRIKLSGRQVNQAKAKRAWNRAVDKCLNIVKRKVDPFTSFLLTHNRVMIPKDIIDEIKSEMRELKR